MSNMADPFGIPEGMRWCGHCNGYGSSLKESAGRCSHCAGTGLVVDDAKAIANEPPDEPRKPVQNGSRGRPGAA